MPYKKSLFNKIKWRCFMRIYNTLTKKVEEFIPHNDKNVTMYTCVPTV